jgi:polysaccharide export outer membrane protein
MKLLQPLPNRFLILISIILLIVSQQAVAQVPAGVDPNNLSNIKIDELSDEQIMTILKQGESTGLTLEQAQELATKRGLPAAEAQKLKDRIAKIQAAKGIEGKITPDKETKVVEKIAEESEKANLVTGKIEDAGGFSKGVKSIVYGQEYFRNGDLKLYDKSTDAKAPSNYIIGIGDEIGISIFGYSYYNEVLKVDNRGAINPSQMGPIFIKGLSYEKAKQLIKSKMSQYFDLSNNKLDITLAYSRSITVNIVGEVIKPGSYKIPAINTAFNALIIAGGPNDIGSLRNIQVRREGKIVKTLDVYAFLNDPNSKQDFYLEENDFIVVTASKKLIKVAGEINRSATYELKDTESFKELLLYAGGFKSNANTSVLQLTRYTANGIRVFDIQWDSLQKTNTVFKLMPGDSIYVRTNVADMKNTVTVKGAVSLPGNFEFKQGDKVLDLIQKAGGLRVGAISQSGYLIRYKDDEKLEFKTINIDEVLKTPSSANNILLNDRDLLIISSYKDYLDSMKVKVMGEVRNPINLDFSQGMTLGNALFLAGGLNITSDNLRIEISRISFFADTYIDGDPVKIDVEKIQVPKNLLLNTEQLNFKLQPFDQIFVRRIADFEYQQNVEIVGEVKYPGVYSKIHKDDRISDLLKRSGGLTKYAFPEGAYLYRPELQGNFIVLKLEDVLKNRNSKYNYILKNGDRLTIPTVIDFIGIRGKTTEYLSIIDREQINAPYIRGKRANYYVKEFGNGFSKNSWRRKTYVIENNAKVNRTRNFYIFKIYPKVRKGSVIYVVNKPVKPEKEKDVQKTPFDWNKFIENTSVKITGIATIYLLFRNL